MELPTLYDYYTKNGIVSGLSDAKPHFTLNNTPITIYSGALHYFRVPRAYWRDRLRKYRAAGLNAVETYVPWNLHEYENGAYDFGRGGSDFEQFLDIVEFVNLAKEEDLFVILRPGPYICAEWDFGGLPSWLLRYDGIRVRTNDKTYISLVERYFKQLFGLIKPLQFTKGGAIIAVQIENEYGNVDDGVNPVDTDYLNKLKDIIRENGIVELLFTSDTPSNGFTGTLPGILATANLQSDADKELSLLKEFQPGKPLMVMEYWTGWFDHWSERHHTRSAKEFGDVLDDILKFGASVNFYMFHGGTNWGFLNGANLKEKSVKAIDNATFQPDTTSYDYDAALSESGDYTDKYEVTKELIAKYNKIKIRQPPQPAPPKRIAYPQISITEELSLTELIKQTPIISIDKLIPMELLPINNNSGQSYGYIVYRKNNLNIPENSVLKIEGRVCDTVLVLINGVLISDVLKSKSDLDKFGYWREKNSTLNLGTNEYKNATLDLLVENWGRSNYGFLPQFNQHKGLWQGNVLINDKVIEFNEAAPLEFKKNWVGNLKNWDNKPSFGTPGPKLFKAVLRLENEPVDTFIDFRDWCKGFVIVNGFVLSRFLRLGPQQSAYLPAPFLRKGDNEILVFEHFIGSKFIRFVDGLIFEES